MKEYTKPLFEVISFEGDDNVMKLSSINFNITNNKKSTEYNVVDF